jgi:hypothetical protein
MVKMRLNQRTRQKSCKYFLEYDGEMDQYRTLSILIMNMHIVTAIKRDLAAFAAASNILRNAVR